MNAPRVHGFDFADAEEVFGNVTSSFEDERFDYGEQRFLTLLVRGVVRRGWKPPPPKIAISLRIDEDVLAWFKAQGPGASTRFSTPI